MLALAFRAICFLSCIAFPTVAQSVVGGAGANVCKGKPVPAGVFPWLARITAQDVGGTPETICTGSVIDSHHILTAAHCFMEKSPGASQRKIDIHLGPDGAHKQLLASRVCVNPSWDPETGTGADLAVVTSDVKLSVTPLPLISNETAHIENIGQGAILAGFGYECPGFPQGAAQYTDALKVISRQECTRVLNEYVHHPPQPLWNITENELCTRDNVTDSGAAHGDSGGPLFHKFASVDGKDAFLLFAVVHGGQLQGVGLPDVYHRVLPHIDWVNKVMSGARPDVCKSTIARVIV